MRKNPKARKIFSVAIIGVMGVLVFLCLGSVLTTYLFPVPPTLLIFSPPPPKVLDFTQVDEIVIDDRWSGLALYASYDAHYDLKRGEGEFSGKADFTVGMFEPQQASVPLSAPVDEIKDFTDRLAQSKLERGIYTPTLDHTDDNPNIEIVLKHQGKEVASFSSVSQGEAHAPWKVSINGSAYILRSGVPAQALEKMKKNLRQDVLESMIDQAGK